MFIMYVYIYIYIKVGYPMVGFPCFIGIFGLKRTIKSWKKTTTSVIECQSNEFRFSQGSRPIKSSFINPFDDGYTYRKF